MNYKSVKYLLLFIIPLLIFLIWFLFFNPPKQFQKNNFDLKKEGSNSKQKKEIVPIDEKIKKEYSKSTFNKNGKEKNRYKKIKSENKSQPTIINSDYNESINKDTSTIQDTIIEVEAEKQNIYENKVITRAPPVVTEIPKQIISQGQKFPVIDLKHFVLDTRDNSGDINWQLSGNENLNFSISRDKLLKVELPDDKWYGSDTLTLVAVNSANLSSSTKIVFEVQEPDLINRNPIKPVKDILVTGVEDVLSFTVNPLQWESNDFINAASIVGGTFLLTRVDNKIRKDFVGGGNYQNNTLMNIGKFYGETSTSQYASLGITLLGITTGDKKIIRTGLEVFESYLIADRITYILKYVFGRDRPWENNGAFTFTPFSKRENKINSLPSGHATNAFALSTVLSSYTDNIYLKILIYTPAFITAISRVYQDYHWASDVFLGGAIGYVVGSYLVNRHNKILSGNLFFSVDKQGRIGLIYKF